MSLLPRDELRLGLCPERVVLARYARGLRRRLKAKALIHFDPPPASPLWANAATELGRVLLSPIGSDCDLTVVLSAHFVRLALLPWSASLSARSEWHAYARHVFSRTYGARADAWRVLACGTGRKASWVACAVDEGLLDALARISREHGVRRLSIQPYLMAAFNRMRGAIKERSGWLVLAERDRITLAALAEGAWKSIRARNIDADWGSDLELFLDREAALCGMEEQLEQVYLCASEPLDEPALPGARLRVADLTLPRGASADLRAYAMALA